jgi:hypothetical protein
MRLRVALDGAADWRRSPEWSPSLSLSGKLAPAWPVPPGRPEAQLRGGHYSAIVESNVVGPEGGQILVDRTVELINSMWSDKK